MKKRCSSLLLVICLTAQTGWAQDSSNKEGTNMGLTAAGLATVAVAAGLTARNTQSTAAFYLASGVSAAAGTAATVAGISAASDGIKEKPSLTLAAVATTTVLALAALIPLSLVHH